MAGKDPYLHGHIKRIASHPFRADTSRCPWMTRHRWMSVPELMLEQVHEILRPPIPVPMKT